MLNGVFLPAAGKTTGDALADVRNSVHTLAKLATPFADGEKIAALPAFRIRIYQTTSRSSLAISAGGATYGCEGGVC